MFQILSFTNANNPQIVLLVPILLLSITTQDFRNYYKISGATVRQKLAEKIYFFQIFAEDKFCGF